MVGGELDKIASLLCTLYDYKVHAWHHAEGLFNPNAMKCPHVSNLDRTRRLAGCEESLVP
jgi:hypothetical protein